MSFERLQCIKPDVAHLRVFGCGAYIFLPKDICTNNLSPRSELMTFIGLSEGTKGYIFMRSPNNIVFTAIQALFDETLFPKCPNMHQLEFTPVGLPPTDQQGEHNIPLDDENEDHGGDLPQVPLQARPVPPQPPAQYYPPLPPSSPSSGMPLPEEKGRALPSPNQSPPLDDDPFGFAPLLDDEDMYMSRPMTPLVSQKLTHPRLEDLFPPLPSHSISPTEEDLQEEVRVYRDQPPERLSVGDPRHPRYNSPWTQQQLRCYIAENPIRTLDTFPGHMRNRSDELEQLKNDPRPVTPPSPTPRRHLPPSSGFGAPPRCSTRIRQPTFRPDNVYRNRPPVDILADRDDDPFQGPSQRNQSPGPSGGGSGNNQPSAGPSASADLAKMA